VPGFLLKTYDLLEMKHIFVLIRFKPAYALNGQIAKKILAVLKSDTEQPNDNAIRIALSEIEGLDREDWAFVFHLNVHIPMGWLRAPDTYQVFVAIWEELKLAANEQNAQRIYDLTDAVENLPNSLVRGQIIPLDFWMWIGSYRDRWNPDFLLAEEKTVKENENKVLRLQSGCRYEYQKRKGFFRRLFHF